jgi:hypothetical protein
VAVAKLPQASQNCVLGRRCSFELTDVEAARDVATRIARVFGEVVPRWDDLTCDQQNNFAVEVIDETGHTVLVVPFREGEVLKSH